MSRFVSLEVVEAVAARLSSYAPLADLNVQVCDSMPDTTNEFPLVILSTLQEEPQNALGDTTPSSRIEKVELDIECWSDSASRKESITIMDRAVDALQAEPLALSRGVATLAFIGGLRTTPLSVSGTSFWQAKTTVTLYVNV